MSLLGSSLYRGNSSPTLLLAGRLASSRSLPKVVPHGIGCAHSSGHINGSVVDLGLSNNRDAIRSRIGGAGREWRGWGGTLAPDKPGRFFTDSHQHNNRTHLRHRWCGWVVDHCGALSAGGSFLRSRNSAFCLGGKPPSFREWRLAETGLARITALGSLHAEEEGRA